MTIREAQFPTAISYGSKGGPRWKTEVVYTTSGAETRVCRWASPHHVYDVRHAVKSQTDATELATFWLNTQGSKERFRFKDWADYATTSDWVTTDGQSVAMTDENIGTGDGAAVLFYLTKTYGAGPVRWKRGILRPVASTLLVAVDGVAQTNPTHYTVTAQGGFITFVSAPADGAQITAGFEFDVECTFGPSLDDTGLPTTIDGYASSSIDNIPIVEVIEGVEHPQQAFMGGADTKIVDAHIKLGPLDTRVQNIEFTVSGGEVHLPNIAGLAYGGPHFVIINGSSVESFDVESETGTEQTVAPGESYEFWVMRGSGDVPEWRAMG